MHNYLLYTGAAAKTVSALHIVANEHSWLLNCGLLQEVRRDYAGRILNDEGEVVAAVHQYDRFPALVSAFEQQWPVFNEGQAIVARG